MNFKHIAAAISTLLLAASAGATTVSSGDVADDWFSANANYTAFTLSGNPGDVYLRTFGIGGLNRSALEFSLSNIAPNSLIQSAVFTVQSRGTAVAGANFNFYGYNGDGAITVEDATRTGTLLASTAIGAGTPTYDIDATALIQSLVDANAAYAGFLITVSVQNSFIGNDLCSREMSPGLACAPKLTVNYSERAAAVPEPGSLALFGAAIAGLAAVRRRKSAK
jgi:hypothetical protein